MIDKSLSVSEEPDVSEFDIKEKEKEYIIKLYIKGLNKYELKIDIKDDKLTVTGESTINEKTQGPSSTIYRSFYKMTIMPDDANIDSLDAEIINDQLIIKFRKK